MRSSILCWLIALGCGQPSDAPRGSDAASPDGGARPDASAEPSCSELDYEACRYLPRQHAVGVFEGGVVHDAALDRDNNILFRAPTDASGPFPVVIHSHGGEFNDGGHRLGDAWGDALAAYGYVVIHVGHSVPNRRQVDAMCRFAGVPESECTSASFAEAVARPRDVIAIMDDLASLGARLEAAGGPALDPSRVAVFGWSAGSATGLSLAGAVRELTPSVPRFVITDDRPLATVALSPQGPGYIGYFATPDENSWESITTPVFVATGDNDIKEQNPELLGVIRREAWEYLPGGSLDQHLLYSHIEAGTGAHGTYSLDDLASEEPRLARLSLALVSSVAAFLDQHLRGDAAADAYLASDRPRVLAGADHTEWLVK